MSALFTWLEQQLVVDEQIKSVACGLEALIHIELTARSVLVRFVRIIVSARVDFAVVVYGVLVVANAGRVRHELPSRDHHWLAFVLERWHVTWQILGDRFVKVE